MPPLHALVLPLLAPFALPPSAVQEGSPRGGVDWFAGTYAEALAEARARETLVMVEFWADWCGWCKQHERTNLVDARVLEALGDFVCFGADLSQDEDGNIADASAAALMNRFGVRRFPGIVFVGPDDRPQDLISGYLAAPRFLAEVARVKRGDSSIADYERRIATDPDDLELRYRYALKLDALGDAAGYQAQLDRIAARDPEGVSLPRRRMALGLLREQLWGCMRDPDVEPDPAELRAFLAEARFDENRCNGWLLMAVVEDELGNGKAARAAYRKAWEHVPEDQVAPVGNGIAWGYWTRRDELGSRDKRWALQVATRATEAFEASSDDPVAIAQYVDTLACCHYMNGRRARALELIERCIELAPDDPVYVERRALFEARG